MDSDIELWNARRKKVAAEEGLDPADFEQLLLDNRDAYPVPDGAEGTQGDKALSSDSMNLSVKENDNEKTNQRLLPSQKEVVDGQRLDQTTRSRSSEKLDERLIIGILWDGSDSGSAEELFHALPRSNRIVYLVEQAVSNRYMALEVEEIRRYTKIPVVEAIDGLAVLPGRIYLGPYMQQLTLEDTCIKLQMGLSESSLPEQSRGFFSSIAEHSNTIPVGIIFDGSNDGQVALADKADHSMVGALSGSQNKDLVYAETVNTLVNAGGHVFFQDPDLHQSEIIVTNDSGHAAAIKASASEISVGLQRLLQGEKLDDEFAVVVKKSPAIPESNTNIEAEIQEENKAEVEIEIDVQPSWETEVSVSTDDLNQPQSSVEAPIENLDIEETETISGELEVGIVPDIEDQVQDEKIKTSGELPELNAEIVALKSEIKALQLQNIRLEEENAELIDICQTLDTEDEAANLNYFFGPDPLDIPDTTLLLLDKRLKLRSFNQAAEDSILAVDNINIGQTMFKLFSAKQVDYKEVRTLENQIQASLDAQRSSHGELDTVEIHCNDKNYSINIAPMQAQTGKTIGVALSWLNL